MSGRLVRTVVLHPHRSLRIIGPRMYLDDQPLPMATYANGLWRHNDRVYSSIVIGTLLRVTLFTRDHHLRLHYPYEVAFFNGEVQLDALPIGHFRASDDLWHEPPDSYTRIEIRPEQVFSRL